MVWFRVNDGLPNSRKVLSIPKRRRATAIGVWTLAGAWSAGELTDGYVPNYALEEIPSGPQFAPDLVAAGLWRVVSKGARRSADVSTMDSRDVPDVSPTFFQPFPDDGYLFHDWDDYQPSKDEVTKEREAHAARQKAYRERMKAKRDAERDASRDGPVTVPSVTAPRPDPTRPDPTVVPTELLGDVQESTQAPPKVKRGTRIPADFAVTDAMRQWAFQKAHGVDVERSTTRFRNHFEMIPGAKGLMLDWNKCWQNWLLSDFDKLPAAHQSTYQRKPGERRAMY